MQVNSQQRLKTSAESDKTLYLNPAQIRLTEYGVDDFYWPISRNEMESLRDELQFNLTELLRGKLTGNTVDWKVFRILMYEVIQEMLMTFQVVALKNRAQNLGYLIEATGNFRLYNALLSGNEPTPPRFSDWLWEGLKRPNIIVRSLRLVRDLIPFGPFKRKRLFLINKNLDTVAIAAQPFMYAHAEIVKNETGRSIVLASFWEWFSISHADKKEMHKTPALSEEVIDSVISISKNAFEKHGEILPDLMVEYFYGWIKKSSIPVRFYYERLIKQPMKLPRILWYGSTNHLWTRILRYSVQHSGGYCLGHDHGRGISVCPNRGEHGVVLDLCDEYVSYSPFLSRQFELLGRDIQKVLPEHVPKFTCRDDLCLPGSAVRIRKGDNNRSTRIMYLAPIYFGEKVYLNCLPPDIVTIDWQMRLLRSLSGWGLDVLYKTHPENSFEIPSALLSIDRVKLVDGYIEQCYDVADVFVFDFISSPFKTVAYTNKPMVYINFRHGILSQETLSVLSKRCAIIDGWYDDENRAQVNWHEMKEAIDVAKTLSDDRGCVTTLFGAKQ